MLNKNSLNKILLMIGFISGGVISQYYGSKGLEEFDQKFIKTDTETESTDNVTVDNINNSLNKVHEMLENIREDYITRENNIKGNESELLTNIKNQVEIVQEKSNSLVDLFKEGIDKTDSTKGLEIAKVLQSQLDQIDKILNDQSNTSKLDIDKLYTYLESLSFQQEGAL